MDHSDFGHSLYQVRANPCWFVIVVADVQSSIFLMAFCTSLESQTIMSLSAYATSAFSKHSLISTVLVVQNVVNGRHCFRDFVTA